MGRTQPKAGFRERGGDARSVKRAWPQWAGAPVVATVLIAMVAVRLHELVPGLHVVQPVLLAAVGGLALLLAKTSSRVKQDVASLTGVRLLGGLFVFIVLTIPLALWPAQAYSTMKGFFPAVVLFVAILFCAPTRQVVDRLQLAFVACALVYGINAKLNGSTVGDGRLTPGVGMYDSNDMASLMALTFPMAVMMAIRMRGRHRLVAAAAACVLVVVVIASGSRGGILGLAAGAAVLAFGFRGPRKFAAVGALAAVAMIVWSTNASFRDRMLTLTNLEDDYNTSAEGGRKQIWKRARGYYAENLVIGVGAGNFPIAEGAYYEDLGRGAKWSTAHNAYLQALVELGTIGAGMFFALLWVAFRRALRLWRGRQGAGFDPYHRPELLAGLAALLVTAIFLSQVYFHPLYALLALIFLADRSRTQAGISAVPRRAASFAARGGRARFAKSDVGHSPVACGTASSAIRNPSAAR